MGSLDALVPLTLRRRMMTTMVRAPIPTTDPRRRVVVLLYHSVHPAKGFASATPELFEDHMAWLKERCTIVPFDAVLSAAAGPRRDRPTVAITFDDGYADLHEHALPTLVRHQIPATFFLTLGLTEGDPAAVARMAELQEASADEVAGLSWEQILEMRDEGMAFGSHGIHHLNLATADDETLRHEAESSKARLEERLGRPVTLFAYPFGKPKHHFTRHTMDLVASCGFLLAGTTVFGRVRPASDPMAVPRFSVTMDGLEMLEAKVRGKLDLVGVYQRHTPGWAGRIISPETSVTA